jgi:hypothetical protein
MDMIAIPGKRLLFMIASIPLSVCSSICRVFPACPPWAERLSSKVPRPKEDKMGQAPKILEELRLSRAERREHERPWYTAAGALEPEEDPSADPQDRPGRVPEPQQKFD